MEAPTIRICPVCNADMLRNGGRTLRIVDAHLTEIVSREIRLQRFRCPDCRTVDEEDGPALRRGYRMTREAFDLVGRKATLAAFADVAARTGLDRRTVRTAWAEWIGERMDRDVSVPETCRLLSPLEEEDTVLAVDLAGRLVTAFDSIGDDAVHARLADCGLVFCTPDLATQDMRRTFAGRLSVRRRDLSGWITSLMPTIRSRAALWMDRRETRNLASSWSSVLVARSLRSDEQEDALASLPSRSRVRDLAASMDGLRAVLDVADPTRASDRLDSWLCSRSTFARDAFAPAIAFLEGGGNLLFSETWSTFDDDLDPRSIRVPPVERGESRRRRVGRMFALNHPATWAEVRGTCEARCVLATSEADAELVQDA